MSYLSLDLSLWKISVCVIAVILVLYCLVNNLRNSEKSKANYFFEALRLVILVLFVITFLEPEWVKINNKEDKPELVIASAGYLDRFRHPHPDVMQRYEGRGVTVLNTADVGAVTVSLDRGRMYFESYRHETAKFWYEDNWIAKQQE